MAGACGVSRRTIFRDLDLLRRGGVRVAYQQPLGKFALSHPTVLPPTSFSPDEALALISLCHEVGGRGRLPFFAAAERAALKIECILPAALREHVRDTSTAVQIRMQPRNPLDRHQSIFAQLLECIAQRRASRISYESFSDNERLELKLSPYQLLFSRHSWYVIGRSAKHREVRTFNVGRILELEPLEEYFHLPHTFKLENYLGNAWHLIPEPGADHDVTIRFKKLVARNVAEVVWHKTQKCVFLADGSLEFRVRVSGLNEISWWIMGYADQAEVIEPADLRELVAARAVRAAALYNAPAQPARRPG